MDEGNITDVPFEPFWSSMKFDQIYNRIISLIEHQNLSEESYYDSDALLLESYTDSDDEIQQRLTQLGFHHPGAGQSDPGPNIDTSIDSNRQEASGNAAEGNVPDISDQEFFIVLIDQEFESLIQKLLLQRYKSDSSAYIRKFDVEKAIQQLIDEHPRKFKIGEGSEPENHILEPQFLRCAGSGKVLSRELFLVLMRRSYKERQRLHHQQPNFLERTIMAWDDGLEAIRTKETPASGHQSETYLCVSFPYILPNLSLR